jgi:H+/Na+-translocating ferredoxin:NAD+ oxidoreductase subunit B
MTIQMLIPVISVTFLALFLGLVILLISKKFKVREDPLVGAVNNLLPGVNCGACGYPGCENLAKALVETRDPAKVCPVGGAELADQIGQALGMKMSAPKPVVCTVLCQGSFEHAKVSAEYRGIQNCWAATRAYIGPKECPFACVGLGSCVAACKYGALEIKDRLVNVIEDRCVGCGACVRTCPKNVLVLQERKKRKFHVACRSTDPGGATWKYCSRGCIGCGKCVQACKFDAVKVENACAIIDQTKCVGCGACEKVCPSKCIVMQTFKVN